MFAHYCHQQQIGTTVSHEYDRREERIMIMLATSRWKQERKKVAKVKVVFFCRDDDSDG